jgi:acyl-coenzyme A thioesterase PaaI-like protein
MLQLPHTRGCLVCGRDNPHGLKLDLKVEPDTGIVRFEFTPTEHHAGFEKIVHGGLLATVLDEAMVWAATWRVRRFCLCGELAVRFRFQSSPGQLLKVEAVVDYSRPKLVETSAKIFDAFGKLLVTAQGKYIPVTPEQHQAVTMTFVESEETSQAAQTIRGPSGGGGT